MDIVKLGIEVDSRKVKTATKDLDKFGRSGGEAEKSILSLRKAVALLGGAVTARQVIAYSDAWTGASNKLRQVTDSTVELTNVQQRLLGVANQTRSDFESTATLYSRLALASNELGLSQDELVGLTKTINQSFATSGATAEEAAGAIRQLAQGLAAGALRGDEFNSVAEQAPGIMRAIASSVNMTIGELREFAAEGGITAEIVVNALKKSADEIDTSFSKAIKTFGQSMTIANNNITEFVGNSSLAIESTSALGDAAIIASENIESLGKIIGVTAAVVSAQYLASILAAKKATIDRMIAARAAAVAERAAAAADLEKAASARVVATADLAAARAAAARVPGFYLNASAVSALAAAEAAATAATNAHTAAQLRSATAIKAASIGSKALSSGLMLIGGPAGAALLAAGAIYYLATRTDEYDEAAKLAKQSTDDLKSAESDQIPVILQSARARLQKTEAILKQAQAEQELMYAQEASDPMGVSSRGVDTPLNKRVSALRKAVADLKGEINLSTLFDEAEKQFENLNSSVVASGESSSKAMDKARKSLKELLSDLKQENATLGQSDAAVMRYRLSLGDLSEQVNSLGAEGRQLAASIISQAEALERATIAEEVAADYKDLTESIEQQSAALKLTGRELFVYEAISRLSANATDDMRESVRQMAGALYDEKTALEAVNAQKERAKEITDSVITSLEEYQARIEELDTLLLEDAITHETWTRAANKAWTDTVGKAKESTDEISEFTKAAAESMQGAMSDFFFDFMQGNLDDLGDSFKRTIDRMVADALAAELGETLFGKVGKSGERSGGGLLSGAMDFFGSLMSFDGGGSTGSGSRSGGVDGKGGFPAVLHPNETVIDHTKSQSSGVVVSINVNGVKDEGGLQRTAAQIAQQSGMAAQRAMARNG